MKNEFLLALKQLCSERRLPESVVLEAIETALVSAYKRNSGSAQNVVAQIDPKTGEAHIFVEKVVAETVEDDRFEIALEEARAIQPDAQVGDVIQIDVTPNDFGRIAAQTAKQVILQRIREAERDLLFKNYHEQEGELIVGTVASITPHAVTLNLGQTEAILPRSQQPKNERYQIGQRIRVYVLEVRRSTRGPQIIVSRTHRNMLRRLLEVEVPEIFNGLVEIKAIAREAGVRSKIAVAALQPGIDPVGSCVGMRGIRIQSIVRDLGGEKIDVIEWDPNPAVFIANALSPARVAHVFLEPKHPSGPTATVIVPDDQLSLAIGRAGQNARLAAKLTGWRIDIKSISEAGEALIQKAEAQAKQQPEKDLLALAESILMGGEAKAEEQVKEQAEEWEEEQPQVLTKEEEELVAEKVSAEVSGQEGYEEEADTLVEEVVVEPASVEETDVVVEPEPTLVEAEVDTEMPAHELTFEDEEGLVPEPEQEDLAFLDEEEEDRASKKKRKKKKKGKDLEPEWEDLEEIEGRAKRSRKGRKRRRPEEEWFEEDWDEYF